MREYGSLPTDEHGSNEAGHGEGLWLSNPVSLHELRVYHLLGACNAVRAARYLHGAVAELLRGLVQRAPSAAGGLDLPEHDAPLAEEPAHLLLLHGHVEGLGPRPGVHELVRATLPALLRHGQGTLDAVQGCLHCVPRARDLDQRVPKILGALVTRDLAPGRGLHLPDRLAARAEQPPDPALLDLQLYGLAPYRDARPLRFRRRHRRGKRSCSSASSCGCQGVSSELHEPAVGCRGVHLRNLLVHEGVGTLYLGSGAADDGHTVALHFGGLVDGDLRSGAELHFLEDRARLAEQPAHPLLLDLQLHGRLARRARQRSAAHLGELPQHELLRGGHLRRRPVDVHGAEALVAAGLVDFYPDAALLLDLPA
mmetsp:Transcript_58581/g.163304  ORF Transcript_58581/g.163304 Transcript_58581/m.163304 type:complete len:368 (+) Transcript_58581:66-1169(+)